MSEPTRNPDAARKRFLGATSDESHGSDYDYRTRSAAKKPGWTQAICRGCWNEQHPEKPVTNAPTIYVGDVCCYCGESANTGLYVRVDPTTVPHPQVFRDE